MSLVNWNHFIDFPCLFVFPFAFTLLKGEYFYQYYAPIVNLFTSCKQLWRERVLKSNKQTNKQNKPTKIDYLPRQSSNHLGFKLIRFTHCHAIRRFWFVVIEEEYRIVYS